MASVFDYINSITSGKVPIWNDETSPGEYSQFMVNRALSYNYDTVMLAQMVNNTRLSNDTHYRLLYDSVQKKRRPFNKWAKTIPGEELQLIQTAYKCNRKIAEQYSRLLNKSKLDLIRDSLNTGGKHA